MSLVEGWNCNGVVLVKIVQRGGQTLWYFNKCQREDFNPLFCLIWEDERRDGPLISLSVPTKRERERESTANIWRERKFFSPSLSIISKKNSEQHTCQSFPFSIANVLSIPILLKVSQLILSSCRSHLESQQEYWKRRVWTLLCIVEKLSSPSKKRDKLAWIYRG